MPLSIHCPYCQQPLKALEQHLGQNVRCPRCARCFHVSLQVTTVQTESASPVPPPVVVSPNQPPSGLDEIRRRVRLPAIGLCITGAGTTLMGLMFLPALLFPDLMEPPIPWDPLDFLLSVVFMIATLALGIVTLYGAIKMLTLQSYHLAMASCIAAMFPCYCCFLGLPIGIWAMYVLRESEVQSGFKLYLRSL